MLWPLYQKDGVLPVTEWAQARNANATRCTRIVSRDAQYCSFAVLYSVHYTLYCSCSAGVLRSTRMYSTAHVQSELQLNCICRRTLRAAPTTLRRTYCTVLYSYVLYIHSTQYCTHVRVLVQFYCSTEYGAVL